MIEQIQEAMRLRNKIRGILAYTEEDIERVESWDERHMDKFEKVTKKDLPLWLCTRALAYELRWISDTDRDVLIDKGDESMDNL